MADPQPRLTGGEGYRGTARPFDREHHKVGGSSFTTSQILATVAAVPLGGTLLFIAGLILVGTLIGLALATPVFVIFSPVLVPAALTIGLSLMGFLASGLFGITALSSFSWLTRNVYQMVRGPGTPVTEKMARGMGKLSEAGGQVGQKGREAGQEVIGGGGRGHGHETAKIGGGGHGHEVGKTT